MEKEKIAISIVAHVDSGKTTLSESILYNTGKINSMGRVDHGNSYLDNNDIERERGITVYSKETCFSYSGKEFTLIDTPGHADFHAELVKSLYITDMVILLISASDAIDMHTVSIYKLLNKLNIPTMIFVNKMDITSRSKADIMELLKRDLTKRCIDMSEAVSSPDGFMENMVEKDDALLEKYLEGEIPDVDETMKNLTNSLKAVPVFFGSALKNEGVDELMTFMGKTVRQKSIIGNNNQEYNSEKNNTEENNIEEKNSEKSNGMFGAICYKISRDKSGERLTHVRVTSGEMYVRMPVGEEKITAIKICDAGVYKNVTCVRAGEVCALCGLKNTYMGCGLGVEKDMDMGRIKPVMNVSIIIDDGTPFAVANEYMKIMSEENPSLNIKWNEKSGRFILTPMGSIQLDVLQRTFKDRFSLGIHFDKGDIIYKETIEKESYGVGHYEPLKHYSEVIIKITPLPQGSGIIYEDECMSESLPVNFRKLIMSHMKEKEHLGILTGATVTDVKYTLVDARAHKKHTEGGDFRQAVYRGIRQGLMKGGCVLLEPVYSFNLKVPVELMGRAMNDIKMMSGTIDETFSEEDNSILVGKCPVSEIMDYATELAIYSSGKGVIDLEFFGYMPCHNATEVIEKMAYDPLSDPDNSPDSVFCSHGSALYVKWDEVDEHMHLEIPKGNVKNNASASMGASAGKSKSSDDALMEIFEKTYGPVKTRIDNQKRKVEKKPSDPKYQMKKNAKKKVKDEYLLVDGYNIIFAWDFLKKMAEQNLHGARDKLKEIMSDYQGYMGVNLILVFDAFKVKGGVESVEKHYNITVVYTREAETADMYIEKVTKQIAKDNKVRVATSDAMEQCIILGHGASRVSARAFFEEVCHVKDNISEHISGEA